MYHGEMSPWEFVCVHCGAGESSCHAHLLLSTIHTVICKRQVESEACQTPEASAQDSARVLAQE